MDEIQMRLVRILRTSAERLRAEGLPERLVSPLERLVVQVDQPCVVAVVGQVKVGKSTFVNALLGVDLAKVGTVETTATINHFRHGQEAIYCTWRNGQIDQVSLDFVNNLQGNDLETLRRANGIDYLEYTLEKPYLREVILVDTPGTNSVIDEHQNQTAEYLNLEHQLRERHNKKTHIIRNTADAIIYLINAHARESDKLFLEEFSRVSQGNAHTFNAIALIGKIDLYPDTLRRRLELAEKIATHPALKEKLNTVIPISAGLQIALQQLLADDKAGLRRLTEAVQRVPREHMKKFLSSDVFYLDPELDPTIYPISLTERRALLGSMPWTVFTTIASVASKETDIHAIEQELVDYAGFHQLKDVLEQHIFRRSKILRCNRILNEALRFVSTDIKSHYLGKLHQDEGDNKARESRYLAFIRQVAHLNPQVASELEKVVRERVTGKVKQIEAVMATLEQEMEVVAEQLKKHNEDFEMLTLLLNPKQNECFSVTEQNELRPLFGMYGLELEQRLPFGQISGEYLRKRYIYWRGVNVTDSNSTRRKVALQAMRCYSYILSKMDT